MTNIQDYNALEWPYKVDYDKTNRIETDVLIVGGGIAGTFAAMSATKKGLKVAIIDKADIIRSGCAGSGVDHWISRSPDSPENPEEFTETLWWGIGHSKYEVLPWSYVQAMEAYDALMELEKIGLPIRDYNDEFKGAAFRDEKTKLLYAYDYNRKICVRLRGGTQMKPLLKAECERLGVKLFQFVMVTSLLNEGGKPGNRIVGATAINARTGEFYVFNAKAVIIATGAPQGLWIFSTELNGSASGFGDPNQTGEGQAAGLRAGAQFMNAEANTAWFGASGGFTRPPYGTGDMHNTWYACPIVDAQGKHIPYVDRNGKELTLEECYRVGPGAAPHGPYHNLEYHLTPKLIEGIKTGEYKLPLYADLPSMPPLERRALWGLMVGNEGKTHYSVYKLYNKYGFDPDKDMLQVTMLPIEFYTSPVPWWLGIGYPMWRGGNPIMVTDWNMKSNLDGLYGAGITLGTNFCAGAAAHGRYAGRNAAKYAKTVNLLHVDEKQVKAERERVYAPVRRNDGYGWKEVKAGLARIMQDYCSMSKSESVFKQGLEWFKSVRENEAADLYARNPHELQRVLECWSHIEVGEAVIHASLARKANCWELDFQRLDAVTDTKGEWDKYITITLDEKGKPKIGELPLNYWEKSPYAPTLKENYQNNSAL